jgi:hypothetical protein
MTYAIWTLHTASGARADARAPHLAASTARTKAARREIEAANRAIAWQRETTLERRREQVENSDPVLRARAGRPLNLMIDGLRNCCHACVPRRRQSAALARLLPAPCHPPVVTAPAAFRPPELCVL